MTGFDFAYVGPPPPWDIGRPQPAFLRLAAQGVIVGPVLDAGCGTGENALHLAGLGFEATGLDAAPTAIAAARAKAAQRGLAVEFIVGDALALGQLGRTFATVIDCGLFHVFGDADRATYMASLAAAGGAPAPARGPPPPPPRPAGGGAPADLRDAGPRAGPVGQRRAEPEAGTDPHAEYRAEPLPGCRAPPHPLPGWGPRRRPLRSVAAPGGPPRPGRRPPPGRPPGPRRGPPGA